MSFPQRVNLQPAYVLHQRAYRDRSAIVELFTAEFGRVAAVVKGVKSAKSKWRGLLTPFHPILVSWSGRGEMVSLTGLESSSAPVWLTASYLHSGLYVNELIIRLIQPRDPHLELFNDYAELNDRLRRISALQLNSGVESGNADKGRTIRLQSALRRFEAQLLASLGYGLMLDCDVQTGEAIDEHGCYDYRPEMGPIRINTNEPADDLLNSSGGSRVHGLTLIALQHHNLSDYLHRLEFTEVQRAQILRESKRLLRVLLAQHLGDKPLRSRELFRSSSTTRPQ